jgi:hypothetical protein
MAQFLKVHAGRSRYATATEALFRTTLAAAQIMGLDEQLGNLAPGRPASFIEIECDGIDLSSCNADQAIRRALLELPDKTEPMEEMQLLAHGGLESGPEIDRITQDFNATVARLDRKVNRVTLNGRTSWERLDSSSC